MKKLAIVAVSVLWMAAAPSAYALLTYTGELSTSTSPAGMTGSGDWGDDFKLKWTVTDHTDSGYWLYSYELTKADGSALSKKVSHLIIEISDAATEDDFWDFKKDGEDFDPEEDKTEISDFDSQGNSNPNIPGVIHGIKLDSEKGTIYSFKSSKAPVWGDFYAKDGTSQFGEGKDKIQVDNAIWNTDFLLADPTDAPQNGLLSDGNGGFIYKLLRPDTTTGGEDPNPSVPEPSTVILMMIGMAGFFLYRKFRLQTAA